MKKYTIIIILASLLCLYACNTTNDHDYQEKFLFSDRVFASSTEIHFYKFGNSFKAYRSDDQGKTLEEIKIEIPPTLTYDTITPISAGSGAGSGEFIFTVKVEKDGNISYHTFNNFRYTDISNWLDFEYGGEIEYSGE